VSHSLPKAIGRGRKIGRINLPLMMSMAAIAVTEFTDRVF
jgi:hypothetical protein